ncbi:zinc finger protein 786-like [Drosophila albomicans]|uniref:Zinc finger protein 786-like n=1 Tax=Drosophila albomicans TaxID=7291 RepID=A0A6P8YME1_DROAB|nr:zinc finger protein 786-like [Drosophila albomicans]
MANVCRICMVESDSHLDIFEERNATANEPSLVEMLNECIIHKVEKNDPLPKKICSSCVDSCLNAFRFRRICEESYQLFMELLDEEIAESQNAQSTGNNVDLSCVKIEKFDEDVDMVQSTWMSADNFQPDDHKVQVKVEPPCIAEDNLHSSVDNENLKIDDDIKVEDTYIAGDNLQPAVDPAEDNDDQTKVPDDRLQTAASTSSSEVAQNITKTIEPTTPNTTSTDRAYYYCHLCKMKYVHLEKLNQHLKGHQAMLQAFRCRYCEQKFAKRSLLNAHVRLHAGAGSTLICPHCPRTFTGQSDLSDHITIFHKRNQQKNAMSSRSVAIEMARIKRRKIEESLQMRNWERKPKPRPEESSGGAETSQSRVERCNEPKFHRCGTCDKKFTELAKLTEHLLEHSTDEYHPYTCIRCSKVCHTSSALELHLRTHATDRPIECPVCSKEFLLDQQLKQHMHHMHGEENRFPCPHCPKAFKRNGNLQSHMRTHSVERPFGCPHCEKTFNHPANLEMHLRIHPKTLSPVEKKELS